MNRFSSNKKTRAQTMVEFGLILPILMLLVLGMFEVGRMVFVYVTISSASREAVRYGSASGEETAGSIKPYLDCEGIRDAAENVDILNVITDIRISYDHGPVGPAWDDSKFGPDNCDDSTPSNPTKINACEPGSYPLLCYKDRIHVEVDGLFEPIFNYLPIDARSVSSTNSHTLLDEVKIYFPKGTNTIIPTRTIVPTNTLAPTATPKKSPTPTNTSIGPTATPECKFHTLKPYISADYTTIFWEVVNDNTYDLVVKNIFITWPNGSGTLTQVTIDSNVYPFNLQPPTQNITSISQPLGQGSHLFSFRFQNNPLSGLFQVSLAFANDKCTVPAQKALSVYPVTHSGNVPGTLPDSTITEPWVLTNHTDQVLTIGSIEIIFPCAKQNDLRGIILGGQNWGGSGYVSSCHGTIITPQNMILYPGPNDFQIIFNNIDITGIRVIVTFQCYGSGVTNTCQTVDSTNLLQLTNP